jgi:hypothetical protein
MGVAGMLRANASSPSSAIVDDGVIAPASTSGRLDTRSCGGSCRSGDVAGELVREVVTDAESLESISVESALEAATELLAAEPVGLEERGEPVDGGGPIPMPATVRPEVDEPLGMRFPMRPPDATRVRPIVVGTTPAVLGSRLGRRLPTSPPRAYDDEEGPLTPP